MTVERTFVSTSDFDAAGATLDAAYGSHLAWSYDEGEPFLLELGTAFDGDVMVSTLLFSGRYDAEIDGMTGVGFLDVTGRRWDWSGDGRSGGHELPVLVPAGRRLAASFDHIDIAAVTIDPGKVSRWLARYGGLPSSPALVHRIAVGNETIGHALRFYANIMNSPTFDSDLVRAHLFDVLMSMTAQHLLLDDAATLRHRAAPAALVRAQEYLRAHASEPVSMADAAEAARLSIRGMHDQFKRWLDISPAQYLRRVRLDSARTDLLAARGSGERVLVADVARRWGFAHLGRFAGYYAETFGELPGQTLKQ